MTTEKITSSGRRARKPRILIAALGNELLMDDGIGVHVVRELRKLKLPRGVVAFEIGTAVMDALHLFEWADKVIGVDAVEAGQPAGTVYTFDVAKAGAPEQQMSLHELSLTGALRFVDEHRRPVQIHIIGVEPEKIEFGTDLSATVAASVPRAIEAIDELIVAWTGQHLTS